MVPESRDLSARRIADVQLRGRMHARVYWPPPAGAPLPLLVLFAAGYALPGIVVLASCPDDADQAVATVEWAADHASELDAAATPLLVGGSPELVAAVLDRAAEQGWPELEFFPPTADESCAAVPS
jgi:hypothetical protein